MIDCLNYPWCVFAVVGWLPCTPPPWPAGRPGCLPGQRLFPAFCVPQTLSSWRRRRRRRRRQLQPRPVEQAAEKTVGERDGHAKSPAAGLQRQVRGRRPCGFVCVHAAPSAPDFSRFLAVSSHTRFARLPHYCRVFFSLARARVCTACACLLFALGCLLRVSLAISWTQHSGSGLLLSFVLCDACFFFPRDLRACVVVSAGVGRRGGGDVMVVGAGSCRPTSGRV